MGIHQHIPEEGALEKEGTFFILSYEEAKRASGYHVLMHKVRAVQQKSGFYVKNGQKRPKKGQNLPKYAVFGPKRSLDARVRLVLAWITPS